MLKKLLTFGATVCLFFLMSVCGKTVLASALQPQMCVDQPTSSQSYVSGSTITLSGWAVNQSGVQRVDVYDEYQSAWTGVTSDDQHLSRPDVKGNIGNGADYPGVDNCGFSYLIPSGTLAAGTHTLHVAAIGNDGTVQWNSVAFTIGSLDPQMCIDHPQASQSYQGGLTVSGWAVNQSGIQRVDMYDDFNGAWAGVASDSQHISRTDVKANIANGTGYPGADNCGFSYSIPSGTLAAGTHTLHVAAIGNDGTVQWSSVTFTIGSLNPQMCIDSPYSSQSFCDMQTIDVSGWAVNQSGVQRVDVYDIYNNVMTGIASDDKHTSRTDIKGNISHGADYPNVDNSGFSITIPSGGLSCGTHTLQIAAIGNDGTVQWASTTFTVSKAIINITSPKASANCYSDDVGNGVTVTGWALIPDGLKEVDVSTNGKSVSVTKFSNSPDAAQAANGNTTFTDAANCGFSATLPKSSLVDGDNTITIKVIGKNGNTVSQTVKVVKQPPAQICIDSPSSSDNYYQKGVKIQGWAVNGEGVNSIEIDVDGNSVGTVTRYQRPDIVNYFNSLGDSSYQDDLDSGFTYTIKNDSANPLSNGKHTITVKATGNGGWTDTETATFRIVQTSDSTTSYNISYDQMKQDNPSAADSQLNPDTVIQNDNAGKFEFMVLNNGSGNVSVDDLNNMLVGCGTLEGHGQDFADAANETGINAVYLIAHARLESGNGSSTLASGNGYNGQYVGYYNFFGIFAYDSDPIMGGLKAASNYGWNSVRSGIIGGAEWISKNYINASQYSKTGYDQNTLYLMKWDPEGSARKLTNSNQTIYEYATDTDWAHSIAGIIQQYYTYLSSAVFNKPVYE